MEPGNQFIRLLRSTGITGTTELTEKTPDDIVKWIKEEHNAWHWGASTTAAELLRKIPEIEA
eukprot:8845636-Alexandrium_andersonii.AAC.1